MIAGVNQSFTDALFSLAWRLRQLFPLELASWARVFSRSSRALFSSVGQFMDTAQRAIIEGLFKRRTAYRRLFLNTDGTLKAEAVKVLDHLARHSRLYTSAIQTTDQGAADPFAMAYNNGARDLLMVILGELEKPLPDLARILAQAEQDESYV